MNTLKIGIVEDDLIIAEALGEMLMETGYAVTETATRYSEAIEMIETEKPDLLLLDINIVGKLDGVAVARTIKENFHIPFIFLTANTDFDTIARVKEVQPAAFLAKPVTKAQLYAAIEIALASFVASQTGNSEVEQAQKPTFLFVKDGYGYKKVNHAEIIYIEAEQNYLQLHLLQGKTYTLRQTLSDFYETLDSSSFMRIHRGFIVALNAIREVMGDEVLLEGNVRIPLSKTYRGDVLKVLNIK